MKLIIDIPEEMFEWVNDVNKFYKDYDVSDFIDVIKNGTPIPDNATNGDMLKAMFGADKVFGFIHYVHLRAKVGNWFNEGVVAEFNRDWWDSPYKKGGKE